jgi:outer membrane protein OmpA-like peptidoglycan-associated protein
MYKIFNCKSIIISTLVIAMAVTGCKNMSRAAQGTVAGAGAGAAAGAVVGKALGDTAKGAIIGAAVGGVAGGIIGRQMDRQAEELENNIEDAHIERVGEGIAITFDSGLLFAFDSAEIQNTARENLEKLARSLNDYPESEVLIVGHTDSVGNENYNMGLSQRRSQSAKNYLVSQGIPGDRIRVEGRGELEPIADNDTEAGRQENRRVEVAIFASEEYIESVKAQTR